MTPATIGELAVEIRGLRDDIAEIKSEDLSEIKDQVKQTNGRVRALEKWQARIIGAVSVVAFGVTAFGAVLADRILG